MGYNLGVCPQCNNVMSMPDDSLQVQCPTCGQVVYAAEAAALAGSGAGAQQGAAAGPSAGQQQNPADPYGQAAADGTMGAQQAGSTPPPSPYTGARGLHATPGAENTAALGGTWKTNVLFTILGILAWMAVNGFSRMGVDENGDLTSSGTMIAIFAFIYVVFQIVYAAKIYPSYFSGKPMLESSEAISFLNAFVGGIIFGPLWNYNLTRGQKGISNIVFIVLLAATFVLAFLAAILLAAIAVAAA